VLAAITQFGALGPGVEMHHNRRWTAPTRRWCGRTTLLGIGMVPQRSRPSASARLPAQSGTNGAAPEQFCTCGRRWPFHVQQLGRLLGPGHSGRDTITIVEYRASPVFHVKRSQGTRSQSATKAVTHVYSVCRRSAASPVISTVVRSGADGPSVGH